MNKPKHTPGPWFRGTGHCISWIRCRPADPEGGSLIAMMETFDQPWEANAALITAAPDLLLALRELLDTMDARGACEYETLRAAGRDAIARAEGRAHP